MRSKASMSRCSMWVTRSDGSPIVHGENLFLRMAEQFLGVVGRIPGIAENFRAGVDQLPHRGLVANDFRIVRRVVRIGDRLGHFGQIGSPANRLVLAFLNQPLAQEGDIDPLPLLMHGQQIAIQPLVGVGIKIAFLQQRGRFRRTSADPAPGCPRRLFPPPGSAEASDREFPNSGRPRVHGARALLRAIRVGHGLPCSLVGRQIAKEKSRGSPAVTANAESVHDKTSGTVRQAAPRVGQGFHRVRC